MDIHAIFENIDYNVDKKISKEVMCNLPSCFEPVPIYMGMPRFGMRGQYRCSCMNLHAYDFGDHWEIHKDKNNPFTKPFHHLVEDAPNVLVAIVGAVAIGIAGGGYALSKLSEKEKESKKNEKKAKESESER